MHTELKAGPKRISAAHLKVPQSKSEPAVVPVPATPISAARLKVPGKRSTSIAVPVVPSVPAPVAQAERTALFDRLRALRDDIKGGSNQNDSAIILISACIGEGLDTGSEIIRALVHLGFNGKHVGKLLSAGNGARKAQYYWWKGADGRYRLLL